MFIMMALCPEDVSKVRVGELTPYSIQFLRHLRDFFGVVFRIQQDADSGTTLLSCLGTGFKNTSRRYT